MSEETKPDLNDLPEKIQADKSFSVLEGYITEKTMKGIQEMGLTTMTKIQAKCIPNILMGHDIFAKAKTGSGKTLAFLIPLVDMIHQIGFKTRNGTGAIILSPTRELAIQTFDVLKRLIKFHNHTTALVVGGNDRKDEARKLNNGANVVVATPSRLLDHLTETKGFLFKNLELMVIDEADRILEEGFEDTMKEIMEITPATKQMLLFTATKTNRMDRHARTMFRGEPVVIDLEGKKATVSGLEQGYIICPPEKRFSALFTFLRERMESSKVMVFMGSRDTVHFYDRIFRHWDVRTLAVHGGDDQHERERVLRKFRRAKAGILLCTDVAARGIDIKDVEWIVQFDPPASVEEYIHRVGRTARGEGGTGSAVIFLSEHEVDFVRLLEEAKVPIDEYEMDWNLVPDLNSHLEELVARNEYVKPWAMEGFEGFARNYKSHPISGVFNFSKLDLNELARSFGLEKAPWIDFSRKRKNGERGKDDLKRKKISDFSGRKFLHKKNKVFNN